MTKYWRGVPDTAMLHCCQHTMRKACNDFRATPREFNGEEDHVHMLAGYPPALAVSALVNSLRACRPAGCDRSSPAG